MIKLDDLNYDFSNKYIDLNEEFILQNDLLEIYFIPVFRGIKFDSFKCICTDYFGCREFSTSELSPHNIFDKEYILLYKKLGHFNYQCESINKLLSNYVDGEVDWEKLTLELSKDFNNLLKYYPDYKSDKYPDDLNKKELINYFLNIYYPKEFLESFPQYKQREYPDNWDDYMITKFFTRKYCFPLFKSYIRKQLHYVEDNDVKSVMENIEKEILNFFKSLNPLDYLKLINTITLPEWEVFKRYDDSIFKELEDQCNELYMESTLKKYGVDVDINLVRDDLSRIINEKPNFGSGLELPINVLIEESANLLLSIFKELPIPLEHPNSSTASFNNISLELLIDEGNIKKINNSLLNKFTTIEDIKKVLKKYDLKISGNKNDLIKRIQDNLTEDEINQEFPGTMYILTDEYKNGDFKEDYEIIKYISSLPHSSNMYEFSEICESNSNYSPDEIICCLAKEKWITPNLNFNDMFHYNQEMVKKNILDILDKTNPDLLKEILLTNYFDEYGYVPKNSFFLAHKAKLLSKFDINKAIETYEEIFDRDFYSSSNDSIYFVEYMDLVSKVDVNKAIDTYEKIIDGTFFIQFIKAQKLFYEEDINETEIYEELKEIKIHYNIYEGYIKLLKKLCNFERALEVYDILINEVNDDKGLCRFYTQQRDKLLNKINF